jgi:hypothetical protein
MNSLPAEHSAHMVMRRLSRALARRDCLLVFLEQLDAIAAAGRAVAGELAVLPGCRGMRGQDVEQQSDCAKASRPSPHAEYTSNPQPAAAPTQHTHTHTHKSTTAALAARPSRTRFQLTEFLLIFNIRAEYVANMSIHHHGNLLSNSNHSLVWRSILLE